MGNSASKVAKKVKYVCPNCQERCHPTSKAITNRDIVKFVDTVTGDDHIHDPNTGIVKIVCKKGHKSEHPYYTHCWCGFKNM